MASYFEEIGELSPGAGVNMSVSMDWGGDDMEGALSDDADVNLAR